jgi:microcystin degradation protein MlrC
MTTRPRIAVLSFAIESNSHSPVCYAEDFFTLKGGELAADLKSDAPHASPSMSGFIDTMADISTGEILPLSSASAGAGGPVDQAFFNEWLADALDRLDEATPIDAIYLAQHGAAIATESEDPDGDLFAALRGRYGSDVPIIATLDPHANVNTQMVDSTDMMIAYHTNPHVDMYERGTEAAHAMNELLSGVKTTKSFVKIPMIPPATSQVTSTGPLGEHIALGQSLLDDDILAVSVCSGFSLGDTVKNGMSVTVTTRGNQQKGDEAARIIAQRIWDERNRYDITMTSLDDAVEMMQAVNADPSSPALCFADVSDNPGGGGRGNTTFILEAFLKAGCRDVLIGPFFDPALAQKAHELGVGAKFEANFNSEETWKYSEQMSWQAEVITLHDGNYIGRRGMKAGRSGMMGQTALIKCDGVSILVCSKRGQFVDPMMVESVGVKIDQLRGLVVKSRGHFRAAVDEFYQDKQIIEVDVPGLTTVILGRVDWQRVPRPIYPLDRELSWSASK